MSAARRAMAVGDEMSGQRFISSTRGHAGPSASSNGGGGDLGIAIRLDTFKSASFNLLEGEGSDSNAVGECSYKVFLDTGGTPKRKGDPWPNNSFPTCFVVFPGSKYCPLLKLAFVDNPSDFATFIALQGQVDAAVRGTSGLARFNDWVAKGRISTPASYDAIFSALTKFVPPIF